MTRAELPRRTRAMLALSALNFLAGPDWHVFATSTGRLQATTIKRPAIDYRRGMILVGVPDAIDADSAPEMAAKLRKRLEGCA